MIKDHNWLVKYEGEFRDKNVLEIGSGLGEDTRCLLNITKAISSLDVDEKRIQKLRVDLPSVDFHCIDIRSELPFPSNSIDTVLASLSLHYFTIEETKKILVELKRVLKNNSKMIIRLNSINDTNYGAEGYPEIEHHLFIVNGQLKRFFNKEDIHLIFRDGWELEGIIEKTIDRYELPKLVWEFVAKSV